MYLHVAFCYLTLFLTFLCIVLTNKSVLQQNSSFEGFILIYEYSTISEATSRTTLTPNWLNLMNSSGDDLPFEVKLDKAKTGIDPATIKFIPLLLKTLKKHKYFDKIIEEPSSPNPIQDIREPTDQTNNKNIFSDTRNWMRMPTSRLYTIEYKTSPIVYFKNPTRNIDYFKKVRKIRDYQRIMNYVDKMISERVTFGSTQPMAKNIYNIHRNSMSDSTTPMMKAKESEIITQKPIKMKTKLTSSNEKSHCTCPKRMNQLLNKLIASIHSLLPNFANNNSTSGTKPCKHSKAKINSPGGQTPTSTATIPKFYDSTQSAATTSTTPYRIPQGTTVIPKIDYTLNAIIALLKPSIQQKAINRNDMHSLKTTTTKNYFERTYSKYLLDSSRKSMVNSDTIVLPDSAITIRDFILNSNSIQTSKPFLTFPMISEKEYEDYYETTTKMGARGEHSSELIERKNSSNKQGPIVNYISERRPPCKDCEKGNNKLLKNMTELYLSTTVSPYVNSDTKLQSNRTTQSSKLGETTTSTRSSTKYNFQTTIADTSQVTRDDKMEQTQKFDDVTLEEEEIEKTSSDDLTPEEDLKNLENIIKKLNNSNIYNETTTENSELYEWELIKIEDKYDPNEDIKSMIPQDRASYLEIQRNEWKQDEQQDYDNNMNQYLFE